MEQLRTELAFEVHATLAPALEVGQTPYGRRRVIHITGGTFEGPRIKGAIVPGGADWQVIRPDGVAELLALYDLRTDDGVLVHATSRGIRHGPADVIERVARGEDVDPSLYYFRTHVTLEAPAGDYAWLNDSIYVGTGARLPSAVRIQIHRIR
jgi:hypothetical protein